MKTVIVVPCYNEAERLNGNEFQEFAETHPGTEFVFVNDGSTDETSQKLDAMASPSLMPLHLEVNQGKAEAVRQGVLKALERPADLFGFWDADLATPLSEILPMTKCHTDDSRRLFISGARILRMGTDIRRHWYRHYSGRVFATMASLALQLPYYDTQCGAKIIHRSLAEKIFSSPFLSRWLFDVELVMRTRRLGFKDEVFYEFPLNQWHDIEGSKLSPWDFFKAPWELYKMKMHYR